MKLNKPTLLIAFALAATSAAAWGYSRVRSGHASTVGLAAKSQPQDTVTTTSPSPDRQDINAMMVRNPEAFRQSHNLGKRFQSNGNDVSVMNGTVTINGDQRQVQIRRQQKETGELVQISVQKPGGSTSLSWDSITGLQAAQGTPSAEDRAVVERLVLDSPDQFVLAQLRGASYYTMAKSARPASAGADDNYSGPLWDLIRVEESAAVSVDRGKSKWQTFFINTRTGLIDRIESQEGAEKITAEISQWTVTDGEKIPAHITWRTGKTGDKTVLMDYTLASYAHGAQL